jgi:hypothetical protein
MNHQDARASLGRVGVWRTSRYSEGASNCVEVADNLPGWVGVRDSKLGADSPILAFTDAEWAAFVAGVRDHEFDR